MPAANLRSEAYLLNNAGAEDGRELLDGDQSADRGQREDNRSVRVGHLDATEALGESVVGPDVAVQGVALVEVADPRDARIGVGGAVGVVCRSSS